ncbi:MAG: hypothetical protein AB7P04_14685 [Bacteriovoracia bacterium]
MSAPLKPSFLKQLVARLLSPSDKYELTNGRGTPSPIESLPLLDRLETLVSGSIETKARTQDLARQLQAKFAAQAQNQAETLARARAEAQARAEEAALPPRVTTRQKEYEPALRDESVVQALLHLRERL